MADKDIKILGAENYRDILDTLNAKVAGQILRSANRQVLSKNIVKQLRGVLPYSRNTTKDIRVLSTKKNKTAVAVGPTTAVYWLRFVEKGTKVRKGRGKISPRRIIEPFVDSKIDKVIDFTNKEYGKIISTIIKKKLKKFK